jgi:hypothetical protein
VWENYELRPVSVGYSSQYIALRNNQPIDSTKRCLFRARRFAEDHARKRGDYP